MQETIHDVATTNQRIDNIQKFINWCELIEINKATLKRQMEQ